MDDLSQVDGPPSYEDFELSIGRAYRGAYPIHILRAQAGDMPGKMRLRLPRGLRDPIRGFDQAVLGSRLDAASTATRLKQGFNRAALREFGQALFDALVSGEVRSSFRESLNRARDARKDLRIKLRIDPPELAAVPWEFLFDSNANEYVCLVRRTSIVRYLESSMGRGTLAVTPPLRILAMAASPSDPLLDPLDIAAEQRRIEEATRELRERNTVELRWVEGQTWRDLDREMRRGPWHVFHFTGHGRFDPEQGGTIVLTNESGGPDDRDASALALLLDVQPSLRLAILSACSAGRTSETGAFSSVAATLVKRGIPAVVAMQYEITDRAAIEFSRSFYAALSDNFPIDAAVAQARKAMRLAIDNSMEWGTPVLFTHSSDGMLFRIEKQPTPSPPALTQPAPGPRSPTPPGAPPTAAPPSTQQGKPTAPPPPEPPDAWAVAKGMRREAARASAEANWDKAIPLWDALVRDDPAADVAQEAARAHRARAATFTARGEYRRAITDLSRALELMPSDAEILVDRGIAYDKGGDLRRAVDDFTAAIARAPDQPAVYALRGKVYHAQRAFDQAIADFEHAAQAIPEQAHRYLYWAAAAHTCKREFREAVETYTRAIALNTTEAKYYVQRGRCYRWAGEDSLGRRDYQQAMCMDADVAYNYFDQSLPFVLD